MIFSSAAELVLDDIFVDLHRFADNFDVVLKMEGFNTAGSVKMKTAIGLVDHAENRQELRLGGRIIESSSGNLGVALSVVSAVRGYQFTCVTDANASPSNITIMRSLGADVIIIREPDENGGFLARRINYIQERLMREPGLVWTNQYANVANQEVHREHTAAAILRQFAHVDFLFVGAGTTGTLMGCAEKFRAESPSTVIVAVDAKGSVTFGGPPGVRHIPGLGTSRRPELFQIDGIDEFIMVDELEAITTCRQLAARHGILAGGSTGSVLAGIRRFAHQIPPGSVVVAISPDNGDRYVDMIYSDEWVSHTYGQAAKEILLPFENGGYLPALEPKSRKRARKPCTLSDYKKW